MSTISSWIKRNVVSRYMMSGCEKEKECLRLLEQILDSEAESTDESVYYKHIDSCWTCYQNYNLEKAIRELIKTRIERKSVPEDLLLRIQNEISKVDPSGGAQSGQHGQQPAE